MGVDTYIEALLFYKSASIKKNTLKKTLEIDDEALSSGVAVLRERLSGGIRLLETDTELQLVTAPELADFIETLQRDELRKDIGKAGAETLAIIMYRGPISRAEIDSVRGVNSATILRSLMIRGLINRQSGAGGNGYSFTISTDLLAHLGISSVRELPEYGEVLNQLEEFEKTLEEVNT